MVDARAGRARRLIARLLALALVVCVPVRKRRVPSSRRLKRASRPKGSAKHAVATCPRARPR